jgi:hypothetical protein
MSGEKKFAFVENATVNTASEEMAKVCWKQGK